MDAISTETEGFVIDLGLKGKTAVVTGGSMGIGFAVAKEFLQEGAKVAICARRKDELERAQRELSACGEVMAQQVDVTHPEQIYDFAAKVKERFGGADCWVNNVGATVWRKGDEFTQENLDFITAVTFSSVVHGCQAAFRLMRDTGGSIINISSLAARCPTAGRSTLYGPLKAAVVNLTQTYAGEYCAYGVRVACVMPGFTATPAVRETIPQEELDYNAMGTLLRRVAEPAEIAKPVVFLASSAASYITATALEVSGGRCVVLNPSYSYDKKQAEEQ